MAQVPTRHPSPPRKLYSELESVPGFADGSHSPRTFAHETGDLGTDRHSDSDESGDSARSEEGGVSGSTGYLSGNQRERRIEASPPMIGKPLEEESLASQLRGIKKLREVADKEGQYGWSSVHAPFTWRPVNISDYEGDYDSGGGPETLEIPTRVYPRASREAPARPRPANPPRLAYEQGSSGSPAVPARESKAVRNPPNDSDRRLEKKRQEDEDARRMRERVRKENARRVQERGRKEEGKRWEEETRIEEEKRRK